MDKRFWLIIGVIIVIFGGVFYATNNRNSQSDSQEPVNRSALSDNTKGSSKAKVTLIEYGDFQCPVCSTYYPVVEQVFAKYQDNVKFQFRHLPLTSIHNNAFAAARAAEAAGRQDKFWEMYALLYQNQTVWSANSNPISVFEQYAAQITLDVPQFKKDFASAAVNATINADSGEASRLKLTSTPSFLVNGEKVELSTLVDDSTRQPTVERFSAILDSRLKEAGVTPPAAGNATPSEPAAQP